MKSIAAALVLAAPLQDKPKQIHPKVDPDKTEAAIRSGCKWLLGLGAKELAKESEGWGRHKEPFSSLELAVLTLAHSGYYSEDDPQFAELVNIMVEKEIGRTYRCALQALALQKINPKKYQWRLAQCAQWLVDNQCENGQWDYGEKIDVSNIKKPEEVPIVVTDEADGKNAKGNHATVRTTEISVHKRKQGPPDGDNSNTQYAALGLRACLDAHVKIEKEVLTKARDWWIKSQKKDGGWTYGGAEDFKHEEFRMKHEKADSYGSMTVGGVGAVCIYDHFLGKDFRTDPDVQWAVRWISENYSVTENPGKKREHYYYYLYGLERAGILSDHATFGSHDWYADGANHLIETQKPNGEWEWINDTCFAILFLKRGMQPLIRSEDARRLRR